MNSFPMAGLATIAALALTACGGQDSADQTTAAGPAADTESAPAPPATPYKPVATVLDIMRGTLTLAAERYWGSVSIIIDADGIHQNMPENDLEWLEVWSAGMTLAETGNLLMMPPRAVDSGEWIRISTDLVDVGLKAAQLAADQDFEGVLAVGEEIYNVCVDCHRTYVPALPDL